MTGLLSLWTLNAWGQSGVRMATGIIYGLGREGLFLEQASPPSSRQWLLDGNRMTIGRDPAAGIQVDAFGVSRHHADLIRSGASWSIVDARSTNGTYVNGQRVDEAALRDGDRIQVGQAELVVRDSRAGQPGRGEPGGGQPGGGQPRPVSYDIGWQQGNISNIAGSQSNYYNETESSLRFIASRRGRARLLIVWGVLVAVVGIGLGLFDVLRFDQAIFNSINAGLNSSNPNSIPQGPQVPAQFIPIFGLAAFMELIGITMFIFGLISRSGAKREARRIGAQW